MENDNKFVNSEQIGLYISKCLSELDGKDANWLGDEVFTRTNHGEKAQGQTSATWHQKAKQWIAGTHIPSIGVIFALSGIFGKSVNEILAGCDLEENIDSHLTLFSVAHSNNVSLYEQLCAAELDNQMDEYGKTLLDYVLEFRSEKILLAMLNNKMNPIELFGSYAVGCASSNAIPLGNFLPTAVKSQEVFQKLYSLEIPWSFNWSKNGYITQFVIKSNVEDLSLLLKQKWARSLLLHEYEQRQCEWIDKVNHCTHVDGPYSRLPYLCGAFNCALEASLRSGDDSLAIFGIAHNKTLVDYLASKNIPLNELKIDEYGRLIDNSRPVATMAYLSPNVIESLKENKEIADVVDSLKSSYGGYGQ